MSADQTKGRTERQPGRVTLKIARPSFSDNILFSARQSGNISAYAPLSVKLRFRQNYRGLNSSQNPSRHHTRCDVFALHCDKLGSGKSAVQPGCFRGIELRSKQNVTAYEIHHKASPDVVQGSSLCLLVIRSWLKMMAAKRSTLRSLAALDRKRSARFERQLFVTQPGDEYARSAVFHFQMSELASLRLRERVDRSIELKWRPQSGRMLETSRKGCQGLSQGGEQGWRRRL